MLKKPIGKRKRGGMGGVVKDKSFYHPNGSPPVQSPPRICVTLTTQTHTATPCRRRQRVTGEVYPAPTTFFSLCYGVVFFVSGMPDDDDRVRRSRRAERGGNDNTAVIRRRRLPSERAGQRFGSVHLSDVSGTEGGGGG